MLRGISPSQRRSVVRDPQHASNSRFPLDPPDDASDPDAGEDEFELDAIDAWELSALEDEDEPEPEPGDFWPQEEELED